MKVTDAFIIPLYVSLHWRPVQNRVSAMQSVDKTLLRQLSTELASLCSDMLKLESSLLKRSVPLHEAHRRSARNLAHLSCLASARHPQTPIPACAAATNYELVRDLVRNGMDCMRINCAPDDPGAWLGMIRNLQESREETGRNCRILMELPGPKTTDWAGRAGAGCYRMSSQARCLWTRRHSLSHLAYAGR
jgi:hypothetical protein